jgi:ComF family protein
MIGLQRTKAVGGALAGAALGRLLPPQCMACAAAVNETGRLCADCWAGIDFLAPPHCATCGLPFDHDLGADVLCGACLAVTPTFERARAVMRYGEVAGKLVIGLKHGDRTHLAPALGRWLARAGASLLADADCIVPVPLHRRRLLARRYNQSALLALALGRATGVAVIPDGLRRRRATPSQAGLSRLQRFGNVRGAFMAPPRRAAALAVRRVVLVDDVMTTGATVSECARVLLKAGAGAVDVLTLARVVRSD